jgi:hypothetical protein
LLNLHEITRVEGLWCLLDVHMLDTLDVLQHHVCEKPGSNDNGPTHGLVAWIASHGRDDSFLVQCSTTPSWMSDNVDLSLTVMELQWLACFCT